jgi:hypothetical protein
MRRSDKKSTRHTFTGQDEGDSLARWLNGEYSAEDAKQSAVRKRVAQLVDRMNTNADTFIREGKADPELTQQIDRELANYRFQVETRHVQDLGKYKGFGEQRWLFRWSCKQGERVALMMLTLVGLAERGLLRRLRCCIRCSKWFYAKFNHQRFCGKDCQVLHYQTGEYWKQRRRNRYANRLGLRTEGI